MSWVCYPVVLGQLYARLVQNADVGARVSGILFAVLIGGQVLKDVAASLDRPDVHETATDAVVDDLIQKYVGVHKVASRSNAARTTYVTLTAPFHTPAAPPHPKGGSRSASTRSACTSWSFSG